jgi:hypothetical protein
MTLGRTFLIGFPVRLKVVSRERDPSSEGTSVMALLDSIRELNDAGKMVNLFILLLLRSKISSDDRRVSLRPRVKVRVRVNLEADQLYTNPNPIPIP